MSIRNKVQPGERRILADEYNAFLAMTQQAKPGIGSNGFSDFYQASRAFVKNTTAAKVNAFEVLALDSPVITRQENNPEFFGAPTFDGVTPDIDLHKGKFAILQEPAMPGDTVRAVVAGATWAWLNIVSADDTTAEIADGVTSYLQTGTDGSAKILWKEAGTGTGKAGLIRLDQSGAPDKYAYLSGAVESVTFTAGTDTEIAWGDAATTDDTYIGAGKKTFSGTDRWRHFVIKKTGTYHVTFNAAMDAKWTYAMTSPISTLWPACDSVDLIWEAESAIGGITNFTRTRELIWSTTGGTEARYNNLSLTGRVTLTNAAVLPYKLRLRAYAQAYPTSYTYVWRLGAMTCRYVGDAEETPTAS